jgi:hypothetical protein
MPREELAGNPELTREHLHLLNALIARITHGLNNVMATVYRNVAGGIVITLRFFPQRDAPSHAG